jgi:hypothetical protein
MMRTGPLPTLFAATAALLFAPAAQSLEALPLFANPETDLGTNFGEINYFADGAPFFVDVTALDQGNNFAVYTLNGTNNFNGAGLAFGISNGENGIDSTNQGANIDAPNLNPLNPAISTVNGGNRIQNGNTFRFSMWMRQDPADPTSTAPQIEPVLKFEVWKEAGSNNTTNPPGAFGVGDRLWDSDQNAGNGLYVGKNQSQASWVDINNSGTTSFGKPVATSLVTDEWRLVEATLVIDDDPLDDTFLWTTETNESFGVDAIEEIRMVMFMGNYDPNINLTGAGSVWVDNLLIEVFATEADMNNTPNPNPMPMTVTVVPGDFNGDGAVNLADYTVWRDNLGAADESALNLAGDSMNGVDGGDYNLWKMHFGEGASGLSATQAAAVPEPSSVVGMSLLLALTACGIRRLR